MSCKPETQEVISDRYQAEIQTLSKYSAKDFLFFYIKVNWISLGFELLRAVHTKNKNQNSNSNNKSMSIHTENWQLSANSGTKHASRPSCVS